MYDELELVNHILQTSGESPTATLVTQHPSVVAARLRLATVNKDFQSRGFWFNREQAIKLLPNAEGRVVLPAETLSFVVNQWSLSQLPDRMRSRFVKRGQFIYDTYEHTNILNTPVWADIILLLDYSDLPAQAAKYLKALAAEQAYRADDGDMQVFQSLQIDRRTAWNELFAEELRATSPNQLASQEARNLRYSRDGTRNPIIPGGLYR